MKFLLIYSPVTYLIFSIFSLYPQSRFYFRPNPAFITFYILSPGSISGRIYLFPLHPLRSRPAGLSLRFSPDWSSAPPSPGYSFSPDWSFSPPSPGYSFSPAGLPLRPRPATLFLRTGLSLRPRPATLSLRLVFRSALARATLLRSALYYHISSRLRWCQGLLR